MNELIETAMMEAEDAMDKVVRHFQSEMNNTRAGRANPHILDKIVVDYYGQPTPLNQMANIGVPDARTLAISLWDASALRDVVKAIMASDIGITPGDDGKIIRLVFPQLTEERRKELVKSIKKTAEESKVIVRNARRDCLESLKKAKKDSAVTEDEMATAEKDVQKLTDKFVASIDSILAAKEKELLEV